MEISSQMKEIAIHLRDLYGKKPLISRFYDDNDKNSIDLITMTGFPDDRINSYCTLGLLNYSIGYSSNSRPIRLEILGASYEEFEQFSNIVCTCAFNIINSKYTCSPGEIYLNIVHVYYPELQVKHIMFVAPFVWEGGFERKEFEDKTLTWLQVIPITEAEYIYAKEHGSDALENLLEEKNADVLDLQRDSIL